MWVRPSGRTISSMMIEPIERYSFVQSSLKYALLEWKKLAGADAADATAVFVRAPALKTAEKRLADHLGAIGCEQFSGDASNQWGEQLAHAGGIGQ